MPIPFSLSLTFALLLVYSLASHFIVQPNVSGLVLAGLADFKQELAGSDMFDQRLVPKIIKIVDVSYGGENGFNQAIELAGDSLANVKFVQEKKLISMFFDEIAQDTGKYCYGVEDTLQGLEMGAVETLIVWENLDCTRYVLRNASGGTSWLFFLLPLLPLLLTLTLVSCLVLVEETTIFLRKEQESNQELFKDKLTGEALETVDAIPLIEWFAENYKRFGTNLEIVTNKSQEGSQFCKGFGGIGGTCVVRLSWCDCCCCLILMQCICTYVCVSLSL